MKFSYWHRYEVCFLNEYVTIENELEPGFSVICPRWIPVVLHIKGQTEKQNLMAEIMPVQKIS